MVNAGHLTLRVAAVAWALGAFVPASAAPVPTPVPSPLQMRALDLQPGEYVEGRLDTGAVPADLELRNADGQAVRRLLTAAQGKSSFRFVADGPGLTLALSTASAVGLPATTTLELTRQVPVAQQVPPTPSYLSPRITALADALLTGGATQDFWAHATAAGTPLVEPAATADRAIITFLWRGAQRNVRLLGSPSNDHEALQRLGTSDVWFKSFEVPRSTRLSYQLAPDVPDVPGNFFERRVAILATAQADPLNRHAWPADAPDRFARQSVLQLEQAPPQPWLQAAGQPQGTLSRFALASSALGNTRDITIYRPPGFKPNDPDTVLLMVFDAQEYLSKVPTPTILDNLIAARRLPPVVAVFIANPDRDARGRELPGNPVFADFLAQDLLPRVQRETGLQPALSLRADRTVLAGSSYGGLAAATVALRHPGQFGNVLSLSGSFWWHPPGTAVERPHHVASTVAGQSRLPLRFYLSAGQFETGRPGSDGIVETNRHLRDVLQAKGYPVFYQEYAAGHDYLSWRGSLADGLLALFGTQPTPP